MVCKLAQVPPEIWMSLSLKDKRWFLNERKRQQQEDDKVKKSLVRSKSTFVAADKDNNNRTMPNQYATVKNVAKGEEVAQDDTGETYGFVDKFLEEAIKSSSLYESQQDAEHEFWTTDNYAYATSSISNTPHKSCVKLPRNVAVRQKSGLIDKTHHCGRSKKLLTTWHYLSELKLRKPHLR
jgi:hypothetical protein